MKIRPFDEILTVTNTVVASLLRSPTWQAAVARASVDREPTLVERLDRRDSFYYVVTLRTAGRVTARLAIDANTAKLIQAQGIELTSQTLDDYVSPADVVRKRSLAEGVEEPRFVQQVPALGWRPCQESTSWLMPFWLIMIRDRIVYIRVDGQAFTRLTTSGRG